MKRFVLIGAAGYVAPRHLKAIKDTGNELVAAMDIHDSVGILDTYFPNCMFFKDLISLNDFICQNGHIDYLSIATPNITHAFYICWGLERGMEVICEKPLVMYRSSLETIADRFENPKVWGMYQLRLHPEVENMKRTLKPKDNILFVRYETPRGDWYHKSWKGNAAQSGGLGANIGCHLFDLNILLMGKPIDLKVMQSTNIDLRGYAVMERGTVNWVISVNKSAKSNRIFLLNNKPFDLTCEFNGLHTKMYEQILSGKGVTISDIEPSIHLTELISFQ